MSFTQTAHDEDHFIYGTISGVGAASPPMMIVLFSLPIFAMYDELSHFAAGSYLILAAKTTNENSIGGLL